MTLAARAHLARNGFTLDVDIEIPREQISIQNHLKVRVERVEKPGQGRCVVATRTADDQLLLAEVTPWAVDQLALQPGSDVYALIKSVTLMD